MSLIIYGQENIQLRSVLTYDNDLSDIWGYADSNGKEYALVGVYNGVSIVDVTNPDSVQQLFFIAGPKSTWRDLKTWNHHAYVTNETSDGLLIIDLAHLPDSINSVRWTADSAFATAHNIYIDEKGFAYLWGYNNISGSIPVDDRGALIADLTVDPLEPAIAGTYSEQYVHDGFVRGDTMWTSEVYRGHFGVVDISDKSEPILLATQSTPNSFTHNCWLSDNGKTLFTTDERSGAYIASYDVSDLSNIQSLDIYRAEPNNGLIPHNTHAFGDYVINSYYKYGINILDATQPDNLVEVGHYDTSPFPNENGFGGCWGAYPFLPSGTLLATDSEAGLFVLTPFYQRACYLEGNIIDEDEGDPAIGIKVEIMNTVINTTTNILGNYKTGILEPGFYDIRIYKEGCLPKIISGVKLDSAIITTLNTTVRCTSIASIQDVAANLTYIKASQSVFHNQTTIHYKISDTFFDTETIIRFYNISGQMLSAIKPLNSEGEIYFGGHLPSGMYFVKLSTSQAAKTLKLIKN